MTPAGEASGQVSANGLVFAYLERGPADGPLALCLHGFPDGPWTWRHLLPALARAGYRAVAPWMRGYAPTAVPRDGRYDLPTLGADVNGLHDALGGDDRAVAIGHDWGALAAYRAAVADHERWRAVIGMAVPPEPALAHVKTDPWQLVRSWYTALLQIPGAERLVALDDLALVERLWASWSPGYEPDEDHIARVKASLRAPGSLRAALGYYRAAARLVLRTAWPLRRAAPVPPQPTLYLHGARDGCVGVEFAAFARRELGERGRVEVVRGAGHFLHLEAPAEVARRVIGFLAG